MTLLELILVLGIMALVGVAAAPSLAAWGRGGAARKVAAGVTAVVRDAKTEATKGGAPVVVGFDEASGSLHAGRASFTLPRGWRVEQTVQEPAGQAEAGPGGVRAGGATGQGGSPASAAASVRTLMTWSPGGLVSQTSWRVTDGRHVIEIEGDSIDGVRVRQ